MRAISLWEPWGTAIAVGLKKIETRHWRTDYMGPIAIHCAKTRDHWDYIRDPEVRGPFEQAGIKTEADLSFGCIVAVCVLGKVLPTEVWLRRGITTLEKALGNYEPQRFGWPFDNIRRLAKPVPFKGAQGFFNVPDELVLA
jgi:hypothetical protein